MPDKRIRQYLHKIAQGEAINYMVFLSLLPEDLREAVEHCAIKHFRRKGVFIVEIPNTDLLDALQALANAPSNRIEASLQGNSHQSKTSTSYLLAYHENQQGVHPETVICDGDAAHFTFSPKRQLVIVENAELFFAKQTLFAQMNKAFSLSSALCFANTDLIYGAGNQIANSNNANFLSHYDKVLCFFDYDFGGLKIFTAMRNMLGDKAQFLEPNSPAFNAFFIKKPKSQAQYLNALETAKNLGLLQLHQLLLGTKSFMEQEVLLAIPPNDEPQ